MVLEQRGKPQDDKETEMMMPRADMVSRDRSCRFNYALRWLLRADGVLYYCKTRHEAERFAIEINARRYKITRRPTRQDPVGV
jgi:hypothetical protein